MGWTPCGHLFLFMFAYAIAGEKHRSALFFLTFVYYFVFRQRQTEEHEMFAVRRPTECSTGSFEAR